MGLLDKLWDDTVAGPRPESGLGKLRKFQFRSSSGKDLDIGGSATPYVSEEAGDEPVRVSRKIMIVKPPGFQAGSTPPVSPAGSTPPVSPAGSTPPISPFSAERHSDFEDLHPSMHMRRHRSSLPRHQEPGALLLLEISEHM